MNTKKSNIKRLAECAMLIAVGVALSLINIPWMLGGGITVCSMLPLVLICHRYGTLWGIGCSLVFGVLQMLLGFSNVQYAPDGFSAFIIVAFDYILAFGVIGLSAVFDKAIKNRRTAIVVGIFFSFTLRLACHYVSGLVVWEVIMPNELGWAPAIWSIAYNGSYMLPEMIITSLVAFVSYKPLEKYWLGEDIIKQ